MHIISGQLKGQTINSPNKSSIHPMSDLMRNAIFNTLGEINGLSFLDAFSGSGAVGLEAFSRGAKRVTLIENDKAAQSAIQENIDKLKAMPSVHLIKASVTSWDSTSEDVFDTISADPPYDDLQLKSVVKLANHLKKDGILVLSWPGKLDVPVIEHLKMVKNNNHGDSQLVFYRRVA